jgi:hypothetical protein
LNETEIINPKKVLYDEQQACYVDPMVLLKLGYLKIKNKDQKLVPLQLNEVQMQLLNVIRDRRIKKKPVRVCILKGRQFGISTMSEAIIYAFSSQRPYVNSLIMADNEDGANYLFEMCKLYHEELERDNPHLAPNRKVSNEKKLEFEKVRSQVIIDTAKNVDAGRKYTFHLAHLSEASRFKDFDQSLLSLMQSIPERPETYCLIETTANGENAFCNFWRRIKTLWEEDPETCDWVPVFLSWKDHKEYSRPFRDVADQNRFVASLSKKEKELMELHELTLQQMNWRRHTLINKCGGDEEKLMQEYPLSDEEAFITSGKRVFKEHMTKPQEKNIQKPKHKGFVELVEGVPLFIPDEDGDVIFYKMPQRGHVYVVGADTSEGSTGNDYACGQVIDRTTWEQVAVIHGHIDPEIFAYKLAVLGRYYNYALVAPESNFHGLVTLRELVKLGYMNICKRMKTNVTDQGEFEEVEDLGWLTNQKTKPIIISDLKEALRNVLVVIHDHPTLAEVKHYSVLANRDSGVPIYGGTGGYNDDRVMALCIAVHFAQELPEMQQEHDEEETRPKTNSRTGY